VPPEKAVAFAPGRANLIGEHTDYNRGLCLPFAVPEGVTVAARRTSGDALEVHATTLGEVGLFELPGKRREQGWRAFVRGAIQELGEAGVEVPPARVEITSDLPIGAGLSSSAALSVSLCLALSALAGAPSPDRVDLALLCSRIENRWVGVQTGVLDQMASLFGQPGEAARMDMRSLEVAPVPLDVGGAVLAAVDTGATRELAASGYNERREQCRAACEALGLRTLRDALPEDADRLPPPLAGRLRHVLGENERVDAMVAALWLGDGATVAELLDASHASLRDDFEVSTPEVEAALDRVRDAGALGARLMGGGFGGHVLALFPPDAPLPENVRELRAGPGARVL
jgi:galactokinase